MKLYIAFVTGRAKMPADLNGVIALGRTLHKRTGDVLAYFDHPGTSNGPTEAICECPTWLVRDQLIG